MNALLALILVLGGRAPVAVRVPHYSLCRLVDSSKIICIGRVVEVIDVPAPRYLWYMPGTVKPSVVPVARVQIERVLKGPAESSVVYHEVWRSGLCDSTKTEVGQRTLLFLVRGSIHEASPNYQGMVARALGQDCVLKHAAGADFMMRNVGPGRGILAIEDSMDGEVVRVPYKSPMSMCLPRWPEDEPRAKLADVTRYVEEAVPFAPDSLLVWAISRAPRKPTSEYELRIHPDGRSRLAIGVGVHEEMRTFRIPAVELESLVRELERAVPPGDCEMDFGGSKLEWRMLRVRLPDRTVRFAERTDSQIETLQGKELEDYRNALRAWVAVRGALDCPECDDSRERDLLWIGGE